MNKELIDLLRMAFEAGGDHRIKPFTTDLIDKECPDFEGWIKSINSHASTESRSVGSNEQIQKVCGNCLFNYKKAFEYPCNQCNDERNRWQKQTV